MVHRHETSGWEGVRHASQRIRPGILLSAASPLCLSSHHPPPLPHPASLGRTAHPCGLRAGMRGWASLEGEMTGLLLCLRASREEARAPHTLRIPAPSAPHRRAELPGAAVGGAEREGRRAGAGSGWREAGIDPAPKINDFWGFSWLGERRRAGPCVWRGEEQTLTPRRNCGGGGGGACLPDVPPFPGMQPSGGR